MPLGANWISDKIKYDFYKFFHRFTSDVYAHRVDISVQSSVLYQPHAMFSLLTVIYKKSELMLMRRATASV